MVFTLKHRWMRIIAFILRACEGSGYIIKLLYSFHSRLITSSDIGERTTELLGWVRFIIGKYSTIAFCLYPNFPQLE